MTSDVLWRRVVGGRVLHGFERVLQYRSGALVTWPEHWVTACPAFMFLGKPPDRGDRPRCKRCVYEIEGKVSGGE